MVTRGNLIQRDLLRLVSLLREQEGDQTAVWLATVRQEHLSDIPLDKLWEEHRALILTLYYRG